MAVGASANPEETELEDSFYKYPHWWQQQSTGVPEAPMGVVKVNTGETWAEVAAKWGPPRICSLRREHLQEGEVGN